MNIKHSLSFVVIVLLALAPAASARTIDVPGDAPSIQAGIDAASVGDTVLVQPGRYLETIDFKGKDIVVGSLFIATQDTSYISQTIIDGNKNGTVVTFQTGETSAAELCGFTLTNGLSLGSVIRPKLNPGGGICCKNTSPYLHHLVVEGNRSQLDGGGIYLEKSNSLIEYCMIRNNDAEAGGGLVIYQGNHQITNCIIENNHATQGGEFIVLIQ